jgi:hypothetical protein
MSSTVFPSTLIISLTLSIRCLSVCLNIK